MINFRNCNELKENLQVEPTPIFSYFVLSKWNAWAPGIDNSDDWLKWSKGDLVLQQGKAVVVPDSVPKKMLQRRLSPLAKAVFNSADKCIATGEQIPTVFSSSHGEICKSLEMLKAIQAGDEVSPAAFSLSVHNAIADFYPVSPFNINADNTCALTLRIASTGDGLPLQLSRTSMTRDDGGQPVQLLAFIRFLLAEDRLLNLGNGEHSWRWQKR